MRDGLKEARTKTMGRGTKTAYKAESPVGDDLSDWPLVLAIVSSMGTMGKIE
jgi:hypothetical protein